MPMVAIGLNSCLSLPEARSVLMLRAIREAGGKARSSVVWNYGHTTIARHLRDVYVTEYGIADVRGRTDEDCIAAMTAIADARFQDDLLATATRHGKLRAGFALPAPARRNSPEQLRNALAPFRADGTLPDYPLGSDFTEVEQRLVKALGWLKGHTATPAAKLRTVLRALAGTGNAEPEPMRRMGLDAPSRPGDRRQARLLALALRATV